MKNCRKQGGKMTIIDENGQKMSNAKKSEYLIEKSEQNKMTKKKLAKK